MLKIPSIEGSEIEMNARCIGMIFLRATDIASLASNIMIFAALLPLFGIG
jgi:hypothetical protein